MADVLHAALGARARVERVEWYARHEHYIACGVELSQPRLHVVLKLSEAGDRPNRDFGSMAAIARLVRAQTSVPTLEVLAQGSYQSWKYLITSHLPGVTWDEAFRVASAEQRSSAQRQIGRAAAQLHYLTFDGFGQIGANGSVAAPEAPLPALMQRLEQRVRNPRSRELFQEVVSVCGELFPESMPATLCHEDLNPYNLLFELRGGEPVLSGVLDFESAWAATGESDLARLELWRFTGGPDVRAGYEQIGSVGDDYAARRPILQLLWCLEYADFRVSPEHQADIDRLCRALNVAPLTL